MNINEFQLVSLEKLERALNGSVNGENVAIGGVGEGAYFEGDAWKRNGKELSEAEVSKLEFALLAEYDRLGGLITKAGDKVKIGSFWNFKAKKPYETPQVVYTFRDVKGRNVDVPEGKELPGAVKAAKIAKEADEAETSAEEAADAAEKPKKRAKK
jgi:hypothetical protein